MEMDRCGNEWTKGQVDGKDHKGEGWKGSVWVKDIEKGGQ